MVAKKAAKTVKPTRKKVVAPEPVEQFGYAKMTLRFESAEQKQHIADEAKKNKRTMNAEILYRLFPD